MESDTYEEDDDSNYMWDGKRAARKQFKYRKSSIKPPPSQIPPLSNKLFLFWGGKSMSTGPPFF